MKHKIFLTLALMLACAAPQTFAAPAVTPADKQLLEDFNIAIVRGTVEDAKKLVALPNFSPQMTENTTERTDNLFELAIRLKKPEMARLMIGTPAWKNATWNAKNTARALIYATYDPSSLPLLQEMAKQPHFDLNTPGADDGEFPLKFAAENENIAAMKWLVAQPKVNIVARNKPGENALFVAQPKVNIVARNKPGENALFVAGAKATAYLLSLKKFDVNVRNTSGATALHLAVWEQDKSRVRALLAATTINPNIKDKDGHTPLDIALSQDVGMSALFMASKKVMPTVAQRKRYKNIEANGMSGGG